MQTKKQKQEKALEYWRRELANNRLAHREFYIKGQIAILERKLTLRAVDPPTALVCECGSLYGVHEKFCPKFKSAGG